MAIENLSLTVILPTAGDAQKNAKPSYQDNPLNVVWSVVCSKDGELKEEIIVRWYENKRFSNIYCNVWIKGNVWTSGHGKISRYGGSNNAALQMALENAGVKLSQPIDGIKSGEFTLDKTMEAIATALGYSNFLIVKHY